MAYPRAEVREPSYRTIGVQVGKEAWLAGLEAGEREGEGEASLTSTKGRAAQGQLREAAVRYLAKRELEVRAEEGRLIAYVGEARLGELTRDSRDLAPGARLRVRGALAAGEQLRLAVEWAG